MLELRHSAQILQDSWSTVQYGVSQAGSLETCCLPLTVRVRLACFHLVVAASTQQWETRWVHDRDRNFRAPEIQVAALAPLHRRNESLQLCSDKTGVGQRPCFDLPRTQALVQGQSLSR